MPFLSRGYDRKGIHCTIYKRTQILHVSDIVVRRPSCWSNAVHDLGSKALKHIRVHCECIRCESQRRGNLRIKYEYSYFSGHAIRARTVSRPARRIFKVSSLIIVKSETRINIVLSVVIRKLSCHLFVSQDDRQASLPPLVRPVVQWASHPRR